MKEYKAKIEKKEDIGNIEKKEYKPNIEKKEYKPNIEKKEYKPNIKKKEVIDDIGLDREELQRVYDSLFIVREVSSNLEESPINMLRFKPRAELPRKFSELSRLARKFQKGE